ncbi:MAG: hypothetical protein AAGF49_16015 [Pseudomonadota bacterium]
MSALFATHRDTLVRAVEATKSRGFFSPYPEAPSGKIYGESAKSDGEEGFAALLNKVFPLDQKS